MLFSLTIAQNTYQLEFADPTTYSVTCGSVNPAQWIVKNDSCLLYTPYLYPTGTEDSINVKFIIRINQSGNLDATDNCYIQHQINDGTWVTDTALVGLGLDAVFTLNDSMKLYKTDFFRFRIAMETNDQTQFWAIKDGDIIISNVSTSSTLPVEYLQFNGEKINNDILLTWSTASETNNDYFEVEKSVDGITFEVIGMVSGAGNSNQINEYSLTDAVPSDGINYYRIKQTDYDGNYSYSATTSIYFQNSSDRILVNSENGFITINMTSENENVAAISIYEINGKQVLSEIYKINKGQNLLSINNEIFSESIYIIHIMKSDGTSISLKCYLN